MVDLIDSMKKTMTAGIGLALRTKDEVEEMAKEAIQRLDLSESDSSSFLSDLQTRYEEAQKLLELRVERIVRDFLKRADLVTGDEFRALKKEIRDLKKAVCQQTPIEDQTDETPDNPC